MSGSSGKDMPTDSAQRAQDSADGGDTNEDDERASAKRFEETGEPERDEFGNGDGAS